MTNTDTDRCGTCGTHRPTPYAIHIDDTPYCHNDWWGPTCYDAALDPDLTDQVLEELELANR